MAENIIHEYDKKDFNCPECGAFSNQEWNLGTAKDDAPNHILTVV